MIGHVRLRTLLALSFAGVAFFATLAAYGVSLWATGQKVDDWTAQQFGPGHGADPDRAMGGHDVSQALILLAHQPKHIVDAVRLGVDLQLSGHTHGGQIWPFSHLVTLDQPYLKGLHRRGDTQIYISCGTGYWGPPMRVGAPPEITVIEFHAPA